MSTAAATPIPSAMDVSAMLDGSSMNCSLASGMENITTYASADTATSATRHHSYGRATTASTHRALTSSVIRAAVEAWVCSVPVAARPW